MLGGGAHQLPADAAPADLGRTRVWVIRSRSSWIS
jgi:hypothetical protein